MLEGSDEAVAEARRKVEEARRDVEACLAVAEAAGAERRSMAETRRAAEQREKERGGERLERGAAGLPTAAQDPAFTPTDAAVLARFGVGAVGAPEAVKDVGPDVLLFVPYVDVNVLMPHILRDAKPGVYIGTNFTSILETLAEPNYSVTFVPLIPKR